MEDNKSNHPPPKTRRAQVANACMKCRDAKLKVSMHLFFSLFFYSFHFTNTNTNTNNTKQKDEKKKEKKRGSCHKNDHVLYSAPPLVPFAIGVSIGSSRACTT